MAKTTIEYGERNWNFYPGCNGPDGKPCSYCWSQNRVLPRMKCEKCKTLKPHFHEERMIEPLHVKKPARWLTCFTGDWMGPWVPEEILIWAFAIMGACAQHTFLTLTKQPQNLAKWSPVPENVWVGVTATDHEMYRKAMIQLQEIKAVVKYISFEPLLENINCNYDYGLKGISWVIIGAQTRPTVLPKVEWVREIVQAADKAGVKVFLKNNLKAVLKRDEGWTDALFVSARGYDGTEYLRQEMPCP